MSKLKEKVKGMNPRKGYCNLIICAVIFFIIAAIATAVRFGDRFPEIRQEMEVAEKSGEDLKMDESDGKETGKQENVREENTDKEYEHESDNEKGHEAEWKLILSKLTMGDFVFIGCIMAGFWIIFCIYWLYTTAYVVSKSWETGANAWLFGVLTLVTNILGVACLWIYIKWHQVCPACGKLQPRKANYCAICGTAIYVKCPDCGARISVGDNYCNGCGRKIDHQ